MMTSANSSGVSLAKALSRAPDFGGQYPWSRPLDRMSGFALRPSLSRLWTMPPAANSGTQLSSIT